jgi:DNA invertase Pin-like site-specific DNA recombinase
MEALHYDDNPGNNNLSNLRWGTRMENKQDAKRNGRTIRGEKHSKCKITESMARKIKRLLVNRRTGDITKIARHFGIPKTTVGNIAAGTSWRWLTLEGK